MTAPLLERYQSVRRASEQLCAPLQLEDYVVQTMPDVSPAKWHLAHTAWFFETLILGREDDYQPFHPEYGYLFNSYYNAVGAQFPRPERGLLSRPTVDQVYAYRAHVDEQMTKRLESGALDDEALSLLELGLQHEQQHQELILTDIKHVFAHNPLRPVYREAQLQVDSKPTPAHSWVDFDGGQLRVGHEGEGFHFDNEGPPHKVWLDPFSLASRLVTNGEFIEFMRDGSYRKPELWLSDGWSTVRNNEWTHPLYWERRDDEWWLFTLVGMRRADPNEPVAHLSYFEADAYARWSGARLPREEEWEVAAQGREPAGNFVDEGRLCPRPVEDASADLRQLYGDVWEWTQSPYVPYPGFEPLPGAVAEYNGKFMCNQLVLRGGSCATRGEHIRSTYRNFFHASDRWQFSGLRLARNR